MIYTDYHLHSNFSSDSSTPTEEQIKQGISLGLKEMCFTEHYDMDFPVTPDGLDFNLDMSSYLHKLSELKTKYRSQISIRAGVELGVMAHLTDRLHDYISDYRDQLDFIIASSHLVDGIDPYEPVYFHTYSEKEGIRLYFESILSNVKAFHDFDVYGHLDYVVRYAPHKGTNYLPSEYMDYFEAIFRILIPQGKGIELNSAGLKAGLHFAHPHPDILKLYREMGGEIITIGSDGHKPEHIAYEFSRVTDILKEAGFKRYTVFHNRKPVFIDL